MESEGGRTKELERITARGDPGLSLLEEAEWARLLWQPPLHGVDDLEEAPQLLVGAWQEAGRDELMLPEHPLLPITPHPLLHAVAVAASSLPTRH
jgi:hypothetical protein